MKASVSKPAPPPDNKARESVVANVNKEALPLVKVDIVNEWIGCFKGDKNKDVRDVKPRRISVWTLLSYSTGKEKWLMFLGLVMATLSGLGMPAWLILLAMALDAFTSLAFWEDTEGSDAARDAMVDELMNLTIGFFVVGIVALLAGAAYVALWTYTGEKQSLRIKEKFVRSILKQDASWFDSYDREKIPTMIETSMLHINDAIGRQMAECFAFMISAVGSLAVAMILNAPLALIMLAVVLFVALITMIFGVYVRRASHAATEESEKAGALATEVVTGIKTVTALCAQRWAFTRYEAHSESSREHWTRSGVLEGIMAGVTGVLFYLTYMLAFTVGTEQVANNSDMTTIVVCLVRDFANSKNVDLPDYADVNCKVSGAAIMVCIYGVIICIAYVGLMAPAIRAMNLGREAAVNVFGTIKRIPKIDSSSTEGRTLESVQGRLELRNVTFSYPTTPDKPIFYNMNLVIEPGQSIALVGPSGSGKSTIARLLLRFYDPSSGTVYADGVPIDELNIQWWRSQIGYVAQEPILFPGTVAANIGAGKAGATQEEISEAAKAACAHDFIMDLADGYDTFYSGASVQLSGGQIQRLNLARAIIRKPSILLLDEATSALDNASERQVQAALENIRKIQQVTTVSVSHRLSNVVDCDQIAVIANGTIAERGTHKSLIKQGGIYATLCESQGITADFKVDLSTVPDPAPTSPTPGSSSPAKDADVEVALEDGLEKPKEDTEKPLQEVELADLSRLNKHSPPDYWQALKGNIGAVIVGALSPCESILAAQIIANFYAVEPEEMMAANRKWILGFLAFAGAAMIGSYLFGYGFSNCGNKMAKNLKVQTFEAIVRRPMGWFDVPDHSAGELTKLLAVDIQMLADQTGFQRGYKLRMITSLSTGIIVALIFSWQIGLTAMACVPLVFCAAIVQAMCLKRQFVEGSEGLPPTTILEQGLRGLSAVQAYNMQSDVGEEYSAALQPESKAKVKRGFVAGLVYGFSQFSVFATFAIVFAVGTVLVLDMKIGFIGFFTSFVAIMFGSLGAAQVGAGFSSLQEARAAAARILEVLEEPPSESDPWDEKGQKPESLDGAISFDSCCFHYPTRPDTQIFYKSADRDGFCLEISAKETVAFVGKSGCGKSTAQQLLLRFYEPSDGVVKIDGIAVQDLNIEWLRRQIGYVAQTPVLFSGTVRENLLLGNPDATEEELVAAVKAANAHEFVTSLASGYDTDVGVGGSRLSGGQRQRLCISRAILGSPKILVLDEATSALDNESQKLVQAALDSLQKSQPRTTLTVAHRLTTIKDSDKIVVLGGGGAKQVGTHESLLEEGGTYSELWKMQGVTEEKVEMDI